MMCATYTIAAYPKEVGLRDGAAVKIRPLEPGDKDALLEFFLGIGEEERFYLRDDVTSPAVINQWTEKVAYNAVLPLVAMVGERIVAEGVLIRRRGGARSHLGEIRLLVAPGYRGRGLGTVMIQELCDVADDADLNGVLLETVADTQLE